MQVVGRVVVAQHQCVAQQQIQQRGRRDIAGESLFGDDLVERGPSRRRPAIEVVAAVVGVGADGLGLRQRDVVDDHSELAGFGQEEVIQQVGRGSAVAQPFQQRLGRGFEVLGLELL